MLASDGHRLLFVHVQKTGGASMDLILQGHLPDGRAVRGLERRRHARLDQILEHEPALADYWTFGFVRNPWDRMVSWWSMVRRLAERSEQGDLRPGGRPTNRFITEAAKYRDFDAFVMRGTEDFVRLRRPQLAYLTAGTRRADFIGRTETYDVDTRTVLARFGQPMPETLVHVNRSGHSDYRDYYTARTRRRIARLYEADIDAFGYTFDGPGGWQRRLRAMGLRRPASTMGSGTDALPHVN